MNMAERLRDAWNSHNAEPVSALFAKNYRSIQPTHPSRGSVGRSQVLANWSAELHPDPPRWPDRQARLYIEPIDVTGGDIAPLSRPLQATRKRRQVGVSRLNHDPASRSLD